MKVTLIDPRSSSNSKLEVKVGWSWTIFLFGSILGIPFLMRKMWKSAAFMIAVFIGIILGNAGQAGDVGALQGIGFVAQLSGLVFQIYMSIKGNAIWAQGLFAKGYKFSPDNSSENIETAAKKWGVAKDEISSKNGQSRRKKKNKKTGTEGDDSENEDATDEEDVESDDDWESDEEDYDESDEEEDERDK